ncbi:hypothetical protein OG21DRAFT_1505656 [Imleria badia]|nr:hypothetical protein OG21DRAFT_1505656 [Imleria badia]
MGVEEVEDAPTYTLIEAPPSFLSLCHYCAMMVLDMRVPRRYAEHKLATYTDPHTRLN